MSNPVHYHEGQFPPTDLDLSRLISLVGCPMAEARYVPVSADKLPQAMSRWEKFIHEQSLDPLIQLALLHAEFEALHPFLDGNGRLGRMIIPLFLYQAGLIQQPMFYISAYLESHRDIYYERLLEVSRAGDWTGWCAFFLEAVKIQAEENLAKARAILDLYNRMKTGFADMTHSQYAIHTLDWVFERPIFKTSDFFQSSDIPVPTAKRILTLLKSEGILKELQPGRGRRAATLAYPELLNIAEGYHAF